MQTTAFDIPQKIKGRALVFIAECMYHLEGLLLVFNFNINSFVFVNAGLVAYRAAGFAGGLAACDALSAAGLVVFNKDLFYYCRDMPHGNLTDN